MTILKSNIINSMRCFNCFNYNGCEVGGNWLEPVGTQFSPCSLLLFQYISGPLYHTPAPTTHYDVIIYFSFLPSNFAILDTSGHYTFLGWELSFLPVLFYYSNILVDHYITPPHPLHTITSSSTSPSFLVISLYLTPPGTILS